MAGDPARRPGTRAPPMFQSAPAIDGGRSRNSFSIYARVGPVSIRARHRWRAIRPERPRWLFPARFNPRPPSMAGDPDIQACGCAATHRFNPRPPSMAGDPVPRLSSRPCACVSIRARHRWRAIPVPGNPERAPCKVSIRARHRWRAIRPTRPPTRHPPACFNPRPPSMAGDPPHRSVLQSGCVVSIRARHRWRAIR